MDNSYTGLGGDSYADSEYGALGDGGGSSSDWLGGTLKDVGAIADTTGKIFSLFGDSKVTQGQQGGTSVLERVQSQGGPVAAQNGDIKPQWYSAVPVWAWILGVTTLVLGGLALFGKKLLGLK